METLLISIAEIFMHPSELFPERTSKITPEILNLQGTDSHYYIFFLLPFEFITFCFILHFLPFYLSFAMLNVSNK